jgi:hypothetical protein
MAGTRWVQDEIVDKYPDADIRVYVVWLPVYISDSPSEWDKNLLGDPRVTHYWDPERLVGEWLLEHADLDGQGTIYNAYWDRYVIFSPSATWDETGFSEPERGTGYPIAYMTDEFLESISPLLGI